MNRKLLFVDDDSTLLDMVGRYLKLKGWEFKGTRNPKQTRDLARSFAPDVILLDVELPGCTGWDICSELKQDKDLRDVPVIMLSGHRQDPLDKAKGLEMGADDYLSKPVDLGELIMRAETILRTTES